MDSSYQFEEFIIAFSSWVDMLVINQIGFRLCVVVVMLKITAFNYSISVASHLVAILSDV